MKKLWGTRFSKKTDHRIAELISSLPFDIRLAAHDIEGSIAHAEMLGRTRTIPVADARKIVAGLKRIRGQVLKGKVQPDPHAEDVHTWIQHLLSKEVGKAAEEQYPGSRDHHSSKQPGSASRR